MTVVVAIKCTDGAVIACDSMLTVGGFAQQTGQKIHLLPGGALQIFSFAGDLALAERFRAEASNKSSTLVSSPHKLVYALSIGNALVQNLNATGLDPLKADLATVLAFVKDDTPEICMFAWGSQPRFLDRDHFSCTIGSGNLAATPFLKFITDTLLDGRQPNVADGKFLATWAVKYAIETMAQGVGGPIDIATIEKNTYNIWALCELTRADIEETEEAINSAKDALHQWKNSVQSSEEAEQVPPPPQL